MPTYLRDCPSPLALALQGNLELWSADLFVFGLADGVTVLRWTNWNRDLTVGGNLYSSRLPWLKRSKWNVTNTMEVATLQIELLALNTDFAGGGNIKAQIHNGLFDGASVLMSRVFMDAPDNVTDLGVIDLFGGRVGSIDITGSKATISAKSRPVLLDINVPRNLYQIPCIHAFCDVGCTLNRATFTTTFTVDASPTSTFIPWTSAPGTPAKYINGTFAVTSGAGSGQRRTITAADSSGVTLAYPLYIVPAPGDHFSGFEGCDKTFNSASGQSCTDRSNTQHYRGEEFIPPPNAAY